MASLVQQVKGWSNGRNKSGKNGLSLAVKVIEHMRQHRDWDAAAWFLSGLKNEPNTQTIFKKMVKLNFGDDVSLQSSNVTHPSGYAFKWKVKAEDMGVVPNTWAIINKSVTDGMSITSKAFKEQLALAIGEPEKEEKEYDYKAKAKRDYKLLREEGVNLQAYINELLAIEKEKRAGQIIIASDAA